MGQRENQRAVAVVQRGYRLPIAGLNPLHELFIRQIRILRLHYGRPQG